MDTTKKPERVKWVLTDDVILVGDKTVVADIRGIIRAEVARQIVHEHNTWGELLEALNVVRAELERSESPWIPGAQAKPILVQIKAAIAAAEKEDQ